MSVPLIEISDATIKKNGRVILDRLSLTIADGQHTVVFGPNGCGKSTLLKLITLQDYPLWRPGDTPPIRILGEEHWNVFELRKQLGIVSFDLTQRFLNDYSSAQLSGLDAVVTGFFASRELFDWTPVDDAMRAEAAAALARVHAERLADIPLEWMSTGELRRVMIARALVNRPRALILDEPTSGLDVMAAEEFMARLAALARQGVTLILVTHHFEEIIPEIRQVCLMKDGRIRFVGERDEVCTAENFEALFDTPTTMQPFVARIPRRQR